MHGVDWFLIRSLGVYAEIEWQVQDPGSPSRASAIIVNFERAVRAQIHQEHRRELCVASIERPGFQQPIAI